jgi:Mrp family chromosome partitioning ATPase
MSIIEDAMRRASDNGGARYALDTAATRPRIRRPMTVPVDVASVRRYPHVTPDARRMERHCILPMVSDKAALRAFKILRTRVLRRLEHHKWHALAVSGVAAGEGKTLTAVNLAMALAQDVNTWVYLVDLDLQRPQVSSYLGLDVERGLSEYLTGEAGVDHIIYDIGMERLAVIPTTRPFQQSSEYLTSPRMMELLHILEREVPRRILVFDMPPLLASDDVLAFAPQIDAMLLVVSEGVTGRNLLRGAQEILSEMNLLGVVLNRSRERNDSAYY